MTKLEAVIAFLLTCPNVSGNSVFFTLGQMRDGAKKVNVEASDVATQKPFIDGGVQKRYTVNLDCFKPISINPLVSTATDLNVTSFEDAQAVIDWIVAQDDDDNYPDFGTDCVIDEMKPVTQEPKFVGVDNSASPKYAVYRITVQINYLDNSKTYH